LRKTNNPESRPAKQPSEGTTTLIAGKVVLTSMAVLSKHINKLVGTVIAGALQNRNYGLVDKFSQGFTHLLLPCLLKIGG